MVQNVIVLIFSIVFDTVAKTKHACAYCGKRDHFMSHSWQVLPPRNIPSQLVENVGTF